MAGLASLQRSEHVTETFSMDPRVRAVIQFMKDNLHRELTVIEIAERAHLSPPHLRRLFKAETGFPLGRYLRHLRLNRAKHFLETTFLSVKEVAVRVGIDGMTHF